MTTQNTAATEETADPRDATPAEQPANYSESRGFFGAIRSDGPASLVVFLVALPLCLGIALASGAPLVSGLIAGIVGGIVVGAASGSALGVSGPAAGLAVIVFGAIAELGSFEAFLVSVILGGVVQLGLGFARAGIIAYYFPSSVITGMLSGIGVIIILKQIPHALGYDADPEGDEAFAQVDGENTLSELVNVVDFLSPGPIVIAVASLAILLAWETSWIKSFSWSKVVNGPLVAVVAGVALNVLFSGRPELALHAEQTVRIPVAEGWGELASLFTSPDFSALSNPVVYRVALVLAVVASLETLLCVEAADKLDELKRVTPTNRELKAQGFGNIVSGLLGGLPVTQVIVRSSANALSGGKTKASTVLHGVWLAIGLAVLASVMNLIPLATLAAILCIVGYKLAKPALFRKMYRKGWAQFLPFAITIIGIVFTDLLTGIGLGMVVAVFVVLVENFQLPFRIHNLPREEGEHVRIVLAQQVTFLNKASILKSLDAIPRRSIVEIDATQSMFLHPDVVEIIDDFVVGAPARGLQVSVRGLAKHRDDHASAGMEITVTR